MSTIGKSGIPLPPNDLLAVNDASKVQAFMQSPRAFFYSHVLGWRAEGKNVHLGFGGAVHNAMEVLARKGYGKDAVKEAQESFFDTFVELFPDVREWEDFSPKNPEKAMKMLAAYADNYRLEDADEKVLYVEIVGAVPISSARVFHFKLDTLIKKGLKYFSREHKTTKYMGAQWEKQWQNKFQVEGYNFALHTIGPTLVERFGPGTVTGVQVNGIAVYKRQEAVFNRIQINRGPEALEMFVTTANTWVDAIERELEVLAEESPDDNVMRAFPCNTECCTMYNGCPYADICRSVPNPLTLVENPPLEYEIEFWDPRRPDDEEPTTKFSTVEGFKA